MHRMNLVALLLLLAQPASMLQLARGDFSAVGSLCHVRRAASPPFLCATPTDDMEGDGGEEPTPTAQDDATPDKVEALNKIFVSEDGQLTDFGGQAGLLTVAFAAFLGLSTTLLNDDFWLTPF